MLGACVAGLLVTGAAVLVAEAAVLAGAGWRSVVLAIDATTLLVAGAAALVTGTVGLAVASWGFVATEGVITAPKMRAASEIANAMPPFLANDLADRFRAA